ncbi:transcriptional attenuator, LytR family [Synechococcus sp. PCC 7502]|uniref:LCP family protein n=1 Tax=Synechococcus sp. PCC 7502 TaxID=1173263 RepID=UPI00029FC93F|nr:LCP family protein [Synechococcus sp. PCC 7502]AFY74653.1 transcriptional attenuator, LytR family [Synechococcus sp. PCC 7502]
MATIKARKSQNSGNQNSDKRRTKGSPKFKVFVFFLILALISGGIGAALAFFMSSKPFQQRALNSAEAGTFNSDIASATLGLPALTRPVNVLVLGTIVLSSDLPGAADLPKPEYLAQTSSSLDGQSDAMILVHLDPVTQKVTALSIPRDSRVEIPGYGVQKINAANYVGGAVLSAKTVSKLAGDVTIDRYVRVNVEGFGQLIDALGGIEIYVPKRMKYQDDSQHLYINLNQGQQLLDGTKAIQYMRYRHDELGDIGRVQRQQAFFRALIAQKLKLETITRIPDILTVIKQNLDTNMSVQELLAIAAFVSKVDRKDTKLMMVPGRFSTPSEYPLSYWIVDDHKLARLMQEHFNVTYSNPELAKDDQQEFSPPNLRVAVQDTTYYPDRIKVATKALIRAGYAQTFADSERPPVILEKTQIIAQDGNLNSAEQVRNALGVGEVVLESTGVLDSDVTVRLGKDWLDVSKRILKAEEVKPK